MFRQLLTAMCKIGKITHVSWHIWRDSLLTCTLWHMRHNPLSRPPGMSCSRWTTCCGSYVGTPTRKSALGCDVRRLFFDEDLKHRFTNIDVSLLRSRYWSRSVPYLHSDSDLDSIGGVDAIVWMMMALFAVNHSDQRQRLPPTLDLRGLGLMDFDRA